MTAWPYEHGDMAQRIRTFAWASTPLGPIDQWPQSRRTVVEVMLASGHAMQIALGTEGIMLYNDAYAPMLADRHPAALGRPFRDAWSDIWTDIEPLVRRVYAGETVRFEDLPLVMHRNGVDEDTWWNFSYSPIRDESGSVVGLLNVTVDATSKMVAARAEATARSERGRAEDALRSSEQKYRSLFETMGQGYVEGVVVRDDLGKAIDFRVTDVNPAYARLLPLPGDPRGQTAREIIPGLEQVWIDAMDQVARLQRPVRVEREIPQIGHWLDVHAYPRGDDRVAVLFDDATERKLGERMLRENEQRQAFLLQLSDALRPVANSAEIKAVATRMLGAHLNVNRAFYADANRGFWNVTKGFERDVIPLPDQPFRMAEYGDWIVDGFRAGERLVVDDLRRDARFSPDERDAHLALQIGAELAVPLVKDGQLVAMFVLHSVEPRRWSAWDIALLEETAERTWNAGQRARAELALREREDHYRTVFESIDEGFCLLDMLPDASGELTDWRFIEANPAFQRLSGQSDPTGKLGSELSRHEDQLWRERLASVARTGEPLRFEERSARTGRWYRTFASRVGGPGSLRLAIVFDDISERKNAELSLREADRRKDEFLAMLGHELRNPLAPLSNAVALLGMPDVTPSVLHRAHALMQRQVDHLTRLVNDLLDVSRITLRRVDLQLERVELARVVDQAVEMATPEIERRGQALTLSVPQETVPLHGDAARLTQVIFNLLNNASKYSADGGHIWLTVSRDDSQALVRVRDNGSGMLSDLVPHVFELFRQGTRTLDRAQGGLGLGLTLVKQLVEMHGGSVEASSEGPGRGSEFVVRLPLIADPLTPAMSTNAVAAPSANSQRRVLVVDDVADIADSYGWLLEGLVGDVDVAYTGQQAIELATRSRPDLILCDLGMPGIDGYETCRRLRKLPGMRGTLIAAVSGYGGEEYVYASQAAGFDRHLIKPVNRATMEELLQAVSRAG